MSNSLPYQYKKPLPDKQILEPPLTNEELEGIETREQLIALLRNRGPKSNKALATNEAEREILLLQIELIKLQQWIQKNNLRVAVLFEGRDAAGKGGGIKKFMEHLNPRATRKVALPKPTDIERRQWYFRRYIKELPNPGEIAFFDRSWYSRAVVEPVMGFCEKAEYEKFLVQVPDFEHLLYEDGIHVIKFWFSISKEEQQRRFTARIKNPLKRWKYSPVDRKGQELWTEYTNCKNQMFSRTHTNYCPWIIVKANNKKQARIESMRYLLSLFDYDGKAEAGTTTFPDPNLIMRYHRSVIQIDV